jgi:hypothetical protein
MFCACIAGNLEDVKRLLEKDPSLARCQHGYCKPLYFAVRENRLEVAAFLLEKILPELVSGRWQMPEAADGGAPLHHQPAAGGPPPRASSGRIRTS